MYVSLFKVKKSICIAIYLIDMPIAHIASAVSTLDHINCKLIVL